MLGGLLLKLLYVLLMLLASQSRFLQTKIKYHEWIYWWEIDVGRLADF